MASLDDALDWLIQGSHSLDSPVAFMADSCERLVAAGLPLWRVGVFVRTLHPDVYGRSFVWRPDVGVVTATADFDVRESPEYQRSPMVPVVEEGRAVRRRLDDPEAQGVPFFDDMRAEGVTDYLALPLLFTDGSIHIASWTTRAPGGFSEPQIAVLHRVATPLARMIEIIALRRTASVLLDTYVGNRAGARILAGQIRRGHTDTLEAAIWLSDLRGFTALSDRLPPEQVVEVLNGFFDCQVPAIRAHGGEVLKFMGDAVLAVFPVDGVGQRDVCAAALAAARAARDNVGALSDARAGGGLRFGIALHIGRVLYGNIGGASRLDFTCIGPAVNLAARLEKLAGRLSRTIVASEEFVEGADEPWAELGAFSVAGIARPVRVFGLAEEDAAATLQAPS